MPLMQPSVPLSRCVTYSVSSVCHISTLSCSLSFPSTYHHFSNASLLQVLDGMVAEYDAQVSGPFKYQKLVQFLQKRYAVLQRNSCTHNGDVLYSDFDWHQFLSNTSYTS